jgi:Rho-binding antiterminator
MSDYTPVSCELQDYLEATATLKKECRLTYLDENNKLSKVQGQIVDIYAADGADWCKLDSDTVIRLDRIEEFETQQ